MKNPKNRKPIVATPQTVPATETLPRLVGKRVVAAANSVSVRTVDNWNRAGCPHVKISCRMARYDLFEVNAWLREKYGTRRLG